MAPSDKPTPERIGIYRLEKLLGRGGMGEVFLAWDQRLERHVALKRILSDPAPDARARARFRREARAVARLSHPSIVQIHDLLETEDGDALVMEYVEGQGLSEMIAQGELELDLVLRLAYEIADGLADAHGKGLIHRDLKADNVRVTPSGHAKILDFGLARLLWSESDDGDARASLTASGALVGTVHAMSPEQASGRPVDHRSDLFALGGLLYEMLGGRSPFRGLNLLDTLRRVTSEEPAPLSDLRPGLPAELIELVDRLLAKDPADRPQNARMVVDALERLRATSAELLPTSTAGTAESGHPAPVSQELRSADQGYSAASDLPTGEWPSPAAELDIDEQETLDLDTPSQGVEPIQGSTDRRLRAVAATAALALLLIAGFAMWQWWLQREPLAPLYVAVMEPTLQAPEEERDALRLKVSAVQTGVLRGLLGYRGVAAVEPTAEDAELTHPVALARALGANEVLTSKLDCVQGVCQVELKRLSGEDGSVQWQHRFTETDENLLRLTLTVADQLQGGFTDFYLRDGIADLRARPEDYKAYLKALERSETREQGTSQETLELLSSLHDSSPSFLEAYLLELDAYRIQFFETRRSEALDRAFEIIERVEGWAPKDPRLLRAATNLYLHAGRTDEAAGKIAELEAIEPGDAQLFYLKAYLLERTGQPQAALPLMQEVVRRQPSWRYFSILADLQQRAGQLEPARQALESLLERSPKNFNGLSQLASLELMSGSPNRASELYEQLVALTEEETELTNLGVSYLLLKRYDDAARTFLRALDKTPDSPFALLNLADAELLRGHRDRAMELYEQVVEKAALDPNPNALLTVNAQALAHLGRFEAAVAAVKKALAQAPDEPWTAYEASVAYALSGENTSALLEARRALAAGIEPRWFELPWFDPLRDRLQQGSEVDATSEGPKSQS